LLQPLAQLGREAGGDRWEVAGGYVAEEFGEGGVWGGPLGELGQGFFFLGAEAAVAAGEAGLGAGDGEGLEGLEQLGGHGAAAASPGAAFDFLKQRVAFLCSLADRDGVAAGLSNL
jgi:hypothetical protein